METKTKHQIDINPRVQTPFGNIPQKKINTNKKIRVASVFSGIGAFEFALNKLNINHEIIFACDNGNRKIKYDQETELKKIKSMSSIEEKMQYVNSLYAKQTRAKNFVEQSFKANYNIKNDIFFQDIRLLDGTDFKDQIDILIGGSPCQSFSTIGTRKGFEDNRGLLFFDYIRIIQEIQPKIFVFENVKGLYTMEKGQIFEKVKATFNNLGYKCYFKILNAKDYNLPQSRKRLFFIGFKNENTNWDWPIPLELQYVMKDFLQEQCKYGNCFYQNDTISFENEGEIVDNKYFLNEKKCCFVMSPGTKKFKTKPVLNSPIAKTILSSMGGNRAGIDNYVTINNHIRRLTPIEAHRLMGFSDDYKIVVSDHQAYKQAGNSICVPLLMQLMRILISQI